MPIAAPSANRFTELSPTTAEHVREGLGDRVAMVLDGGRTTVGIESTVLSLAGRSAVLLRPGMLTKAEIEAVIGPVQVARNVAAAGAHPSPGIASAALQPADSADSGGGRAAANGGRGAYLWMRQTADCARADPNAGRSARVRRGAV